MANAELTTRKHMQRVSELLGQVAIEFIKRAAAHDLSKLTPVELAPLQAMAELEDRLGPTPYGSEEYKRRLGILKPMLDHHYKENSHHPEHYEEGIDGMNLFDIVEMFVDWKAATERGNEKAIGIKHSIERFGISPQLERIFRNTAEDLGWEVT